MLQYSLIMDTQIWYKSISSKIQLVIWHAISCLSPWAMCLYYPPHKVLWFCDCHPFKYTLPPHLTYSTNCDLVTEPKCLQLDQVKHNHILRESRDIWGCLRPSMAILGHNGLHLFCYILWWPMWQRNRVRWHRLVLMPLRCAFCCTCIGEFLTTAYRGLLRWAFIFREVSCDSNRVQLR